MLFETLWQAIIFGAFTTLFLAIFGYGLSTMWEQYEDPEIDKLHSGRPR